ncbi:lytic transglycosylase domain-containing protein [Pectobacterium versatile]|uniref:lytic transglycosylase domain-containing protein n=1 Tax=Pectobacterium versatile TaxID=2488639 RepID=UPI001F295DC6|nr:lytic transglycosylase domain-containing protein [Pectobacterium versatile]
MKNINLIFLIVTFSAPQIQAKNINYQLINNCFMESAINHKIDPLLIEAVSTEESGLDNTAINYTSADGYPAHTMMQISAWWLTHPHFIKHAITLDKLKKDPCAAIDTGTWIMATNFKDYGENWNSIGIYNTGPKSSLVLARNVYIEKIMKRYILLKNERPNYRLDAEWISLPIDTNFESITPYSRYLASTNDKKNGYVLSNENMDNNDSVIIEVTKSFFKTKDSSKMKLVGGM